jgi:hypothetical protein
MCDELIGGILVDDGGIGDVEYGCDFGSVCEFVGPAVL